MKKFAEAVWMVVKVFCARMFYPGKYMEYKQVIRDRLESGEVHVVDVGIFKNANKAK